MSGKMEKGIHQQNQKKADCARQQVYIIKKEETGDGVLVEFLNYVFTDYSESRKMARHILYKMNMRKSSVLFTVNKPDDLFKETAPDVWTDGQIKFSIEVFLLKDVICPKKKIIQGVNGHNGILEDMEFINKIKVIENSKIVFK